MIAAEFLGNGHRSAEFLCQTLQKNLATNCWWYLVPGTSKDLFYLYVAQDKNLLNFNTA